MKNIKGNITNQTHSLSGKREPDDRNNIYVMRGITHSVDEPIGLAKSRLIIFIF